MNSSWNRFLRNLFRGKATNTPRRRPRLEALECRVTPATIAGTTGDDDLILTAYNPTTRVVSYNLGGVDDAVTLAAGDNNLAVALGQGNDTLKIANTWNYDLAVSFSNANGQGNDTLTASDTDSTFSLNAAFGGTLLAPTLGTRPVTFTGVEKLVGGLGADSFNLQTGADIDSIDGGGASTGEDELDLSGLGATSRTVTLTGLGATKGFNLTLSGSAFTGATFSNLSSVVAGAGTADVLVGLAAANAWTVVSKTETNTYTTGTTSLKFTGFDTITGKAMVDTLNGGDDPNNWVLSGAGEGTLNTVAFTAMDTLVGGAGVDNFKVQAGAAFTSVRGGTGVNTVAADDTVTGPLLWTTSAPNQVTVHGLPVTGIQILDGGTGDHSFTISLTSGFTKISGGTGDDNTLEIQSLPADVVDWFSAAKEAGTVTATDGGSPPIPYPTILFSQIQNLIGGQGLDRFSVNKQSQFESIAGAGLEEDTHSTPPDTDDRDALRTQSNQLEFRSEAGDLVVWRLTASNAGEVRFVPATGPLPDFTKFTFIPNLLGGAGDDRFVAFAGTQADPVPPDAGAAYGYIGAGDGRNSLDYSNYYIQGGLTLDLENLTTTAVRLFDNFDRILANKETLDQFHTAPGQTTDFDPMTKQFTVTGVIYNDPSDELILDDWDNGSGVALTILIFPGAQVPAAFLAGFTAITLNYQFYDLPISVDLQVGDPIEVDGQLLRESSATAVDGLFTGLVEVIGRDLPGDRLTGADITTTWTSDPERPGYAIAALHFDPLPPEDPAHIPDFLFRFIGISDVIGGSEDDRFTTSFLGLVASVAGGGGVNKLEVDSAPGDAVAWTVSGDAGDVQRAAAVLITFSSIQDFVGGDGDDTFTVSAGAVVNSIDAGDGANTFDCTDCTVASLAARGEADRFILKVGAKIEAIDGGDGANTFDCTGSTVGGVQTGSGDDVFVLGPGAMFDLINAGKGSNTFDAAAFDQPVTFDIEQQTAEPASETLIGITTFIGSALAGDAVVGRNQNNVWTSDVEGVGTVTYTEVEDGVNVTRTITFSSVENLKGGTADDYYVLRDATGFDSITDGGAGKNTFDFSEYDSAITVDLENQSVLGVIGQFDEFFNALIGSPSADPDTLIGPDATTVWESSKPAEGTVSGVTFSSIERLVGGSGDDTFNFTGETFFSGGIDGGGSDTPDGNFLNVTPSAAIHTFDLTPDRITLIGDATTVSTAIANMGAIRLTGGDTIDNTFKIHFEDAIFVPTTGFFDDSSSAGARNISIIGQGGVDKFEVYGAPRFNYFNLATSLFTNSLHPTDQTNAAVKRGYRILFETVERLDVHGGMSRDRFEAHSRTYKAVRFDNNGLKVVSQLRGVRYFAHGGADFVRLSPSVTTPFIVFATPRSPAALGTAVYFALNGTTILRPVTVANRGYDAIYRFVGRKPIQFYGISRGVGGLIDLRPVARRTLAPIFTW